MSNLRRNPYYLRLTEDKEIKQSLLINRCWLFKILLLIIFIFSLWLELALYSFDPSDPSWMQTTRNKSIHNLCGVFGAWISDTLFLIFGITANFIPAAIINGCWSVWYQRIHDGYIDYFFISLCMIESILLILTFCILFSTDTDDIWHSIYGGGIIGGLLNIAIQNLQVLDNKNLTVTFLCIWIIGLTLFTGLFWICISENIGILTLNILTLIKKKIDKKIRVNNVINKNTKSR